MKPLESFLPSPAPIQWPPKLDLFGVQISKTNYREAEDLIIQAARARQNAVVTHLPVHGVVTAVWNPTYRRQVNHFDLIAPDGQAVRWAMNRSIFLICCNPIAACIFVIR